jgi:DNA primase
VRLTLDAIKADVHMTDLLLYYAGDYNIDRMGWQSVRCINPNHDDRHPSASVNLELDRYNCHSCGLSGDVVDVVWELEGLTSFEEVFEWFRNSGLLMTE